MFSLSIICTQTKISREYHIIKGVQYKSGQIATMLISTSSKKEWANNDGKSGTSSVLTSKIQSDKEDVTTMKSTVTTGVSPSTLITSPASVPSQQNIVVSKTKEPSIKKGFLNNAKSTIYPESVKAKRPVPETNKSISLTPTPSSSTSQTATTASTAKSSTATKSLIEEVSLPLPPKISVPKTEKTDHLAALGLVERQTMKVVAEAPQSLSDKATVGTARESLQPTNLPSYSPPSSSEVLSLERGNASSSQSISSKCPVHSLVERGLVSMGDFEALKAKVFVNR